MYSAEISQSLAVDERPAATGQGMDINNATPVGSGANPPTTANKRKKRSHVEYGFPTGTLMSSKASRLVMQPKMDDRMAFGEFCTNSIEVEKNPSALLLAQVPLHRLKEACPQLRQAQ